MEIVTCVLALGSFVFSIDFQIITINQPRQI